MSYFNNEKNVEEYVRMAEGYDGRELVAVLRKYLDDGASVLELGMGPGKDLEILDKHYQTTGSDNSKAFVERYRKKNPEADLLVLDAGTIETERKFDCIYSNKVLIHLSGYEIRQSFTQQAEVLTSGGILLHSFWYGDHEENHAGLRFVYYTEELLDNIIGDEFQILEWARYTEIDKDDSFYIVLKKIK